MKRFLVFAGLAFLAPNTALAQQVEISVKPPFRQPKANETVVYTWWISYFRVHSPYYAGELGTARKSLKDAMIYVEKLKSWSRSIKWRGYKLARIEVEGDPSIVPKTKGNADSEIFGRGRWYMVYRKSKLYGWERRTAFRIEKKQEKSAEKAARVLAHRLLAGDPKYTPAAKIVVVTNGKEGAAIAPRTPALRFGLPSNNVRNSEPGPRKSTNSFYYGIDFSSKTADGKIKPLDFTAGVAGKAHVHKNSKWNTISVTLANGNVIQFLHAGKVYVKTGQEVTPTTKLGRTGDAGSPGSIHLHVQARDSKGNYIHPDLALSGWENARLVPKK